MSQLSISKKDQVAILVYHYLVETNKEAQPTLKVSIEDNEPTKLQLQDNIEITSENSVLVYLANEYDSKFGGSSEEPQVQADVEQWLSSSSVSEEELAEFSKTLNSHLSGKSYLCNNKFTLADLVVYARLRNHINSIGLEGQKTLLNVMRWFNNIQTLLSKGESFKSAEMEAITIDLEALNLGGKKKKEKKPAAPAKAAVAAPIVPSMIDLRVGHIIEVAKHEAADSLYVEQIELGEEAPRTVVSGLVNHFSLEEMKNRYVILVCNLKPANMRGVKSHAMVLCGTSAEGKVEFVDPPSGSQPGDRVYFEEFEGQEPEAVLNPKRKIWETIQPGLKTDDNRIAGWYHPDTNKFHQLKTKNGLCMTATAKNSSLK
ncbi:nucleic acid-binding protein [Neoconidiobolus thromboides FSU 785]|nr:nucleic acid-binding protein [Neoconidiobolus thromboides FSU 785]